MKAKTTLLLTAVMWAALAWSQSSPAGAQAQTGAGRGAAQERPGRGMSGMGMDAQHMQKMQADLNRMHALLNSMRGSVTSMDPRDQPAMLSNIELWQVMLDHMDQMMKHMQAMHGTGTQDSGKPGPHTH